MVNDVQGKFYIEEKLSPNIGTTNEGYLICFGVPVARTGKQTYRADEVPVEPNAQGTVEIIRDEKEVFADKTLKSLEGKSLCIDHPDEVVTPENWQELTHGFLQNVRRGVREQSDLIIADIVVTTQKAIDLVKNGLRQISLGYDAQYRQLERGVGEQFDIICNHAALVMHGRAGVRCAIGDKECSFCGKCKINLQEDNMGLKKKFKDALLKALDAIPDDETEEEKKKREAEEAKVKDEEAKVEELKAIDKKAKDAEETEEEKKKKEEEAKAKDAEAAKVEELKAIDAEAAKVTELKALDQEEGEEEECNCLEEIKAKLDILEKAIAALVASDKEVHANLDKAKDEEASNVEEQEKAKEAIEAKDCDSTFGDIAYRADLLGFNAKKPTKDHKAEIVRIKKASLRIATTDKDLSDVLKERDIEKLSGDALDMAFIAASEVKRTKNNQAVRDSIYKKTSGTVSEVQAINKANRKRWNKE
jgi:uncharacterized protein